VSGLRDFIWFLLLLLQQLGPLKGFVWQTWLWLGGDSCLPVQTYLRTAFLHGMSLLVRENSPCLRWRKPITSGCRWLASGVCSLAPCSFLFANRRGQSLHLTLNHLESILSTMAHIVPPLRSKAQRARFNIIVAVYRLLDVQVVMLFLTILRSGSKSSISVVHEP